MHWKHSRFDIAYLVLGNCHTTDEAYRVLCELQEDREMAIETSKAESLRAQGKVVGAKLILEDKSESKVNKLRSESYIQETKARTKVTQLAFDEAKREVEFIEKLKEKLNPHRRFKDYEDHVAFQLIQPIEWRYDICWQMYSQMCTHAGQVESDMFMMIKMHPESKMLVETLNHLNSLAQADFTGFMMMEKFDVLSSISRQDEIPYLLQTTNFNPKLLETFDCAQVEYQTKVISHEV